MEDSNPFKEPELSGSALFVLFKTGCGVFYAAPGITLSLINKERDTP
jgi:hypothetical protein